MRNRTSGSVRSHRRIPGVGSQRRAMTMEIESYQKQSGNIPYVSHGPTPGQSDGTKSASYKGLQRASEHRPIDEPDGLSASAGGADRISAADTCLLTA